MERRTGSKDSLSRRAVRTISAVAALALAAACGNGGENASGDTLPTPATSFATSASAAATKAMIRFVDLGAASPNIQVYPGTTMAAKDRDSLGQVYVRGTTKPVLCKQEGREVISDIAAGEEARQSTTWYLLDPVATQPPGAVQYATGTYADVVSNGVMVKECAEIGK